VLPASSPAAPTADHAGSETCSRKRRGACCETMCQAVAAPKSRGASTTKDASSRNTCVPLPHSFFTCKSRPAALMAATRPRPAILPAAAPIAIVGMKMPWERRAGEACEPRGRGRAARFIGRRRGHALSVIQCRHQLAAWWRAWRRTGLLQSPPLDNKAAALTRPYLSARRPRRRAAARQRHRSQRARVQ
jgi:hypothetical protein